MADTPSGTETGILTDLNQIALSRKTVIGAKLDRVSDSVTGQTPVNTEGYLTDLRSTVNLSDADIGDLKKVRTPVAFRNGMCGLVQGHRV